MTTTNSKYVFNTENSLSLSGERFSVEYLLTAENETAAMQKADDICVEQTVEFPAELVPAHIHAQGLLGTIESFIKLSEQNFAVRISFAAETAGNEFTQFLNVIFGNISLKPGIRIEHIFLSASLLKFITGPRFGMKGIRDRLSIYGRPLISTALKPMGLSNQDLARLAGQFAEGGVDLIKDDHGLANQSFSRFEERVLNCQKAITEINPATVYAPNITGPVTELRKRALFAKEVGCQALLISPMLVGFEAVHSLAQDQEIDLPLLGHPAFIGSLVTAKDHGFSHRALFGELFRMMGLDVSIYPNFGGRFSFSEEQCLDIVAGCTDEFSGMQGIFPCPGGGMNFENVPQMTKAYGHDVIYLMGGGLFKRGSDLVANVKELRKLILQN